jgi:HD-GYP domain-containing protein (c-di-GMP phosphodiesterase class II)
MNDETLQIFTRRCTELSLHVFSLDIEENISHSDGLSEELRRPMRTLAENAFNGECAFEPPLTERLTATVLVTRRGSVTTHVTVVAASNGNASRDLAIARWMYEDLSRSARDEQTMAQFGERLAQSYEEQTFMLALADYLNCIENPATVMNGVCSHLQEVLSFKWVAVLIHDVEASPTLFAAGELPCDRNSFATMVEHCMAAAPERSLWDPGQSALSSTANSEIILHPLKHSGKIIGAVVAGNKFGSDTAVSGVDLQLTSATADFLGVFHENLARFSEQQALFVGTLRALTASIDAKDRYTCGHSERVALLGAKLAEAAGLDPRTVERYRIAGLVHDVGKIGVPEAVLCKPGKLTSEEFDMIKLHPEIGLRILRDIPGMSDVLPGVLYHHERWDGRGYPHKVAGEQIPLIARILALADSFDAMSSTRSYRAAMSREQVLSEIQHCAGAQFDPSLAPLFVNLDFTEFDRLLAQHTPVEAKAA